MYKNNKKYDLIILGSSFAASFFLKKHLEKSPNSKVLVIERGENYSHQWRIKNRHLKDPYGVVSDVSFQSTYNNITPEKPWVYTPAFGGSSNCWWACTPRFMPNDFKLNSKYGVGNDWPISYDEIEPYYCDAELIMNISGSQTNTPFPMSRSYPQTHHRFTDVDRLLHQAYPDSFFHMPSARPRTATDKRTTCCASSVCNLCPIDAKFTILNEMSELYFNHPQVTLKTSAQATNIVIEAGIAKAVRYFREGREYYAYADTFAVATNPIFNAHILLNSGVDNIHLGKYLNEQVGISCEIDLNGVNNFNGSTSLTGHGYMLYDGEHRSEHAACIIESFNIPKIRPEKNRHTQRAHFKFIFDDIPSADNKVTLSDDILKPNVEYHGHSTYVDKAIINIKDKAPDLFNCLPVESLKFSTNVLPTEGHILGTALMGTSKENSVVDNKQLVHGTNNLLSLGGSSFSTISPANPTLTISALSLMSADRYF